MASVQIEPVETRRQQKQFVELAWQLYANDPLWIPPLRRTQQELLGYKPHPFHDDARVQTFLATRNGRTCGRIAAIIHRRPSAPLRGTYAAISVFLRALTMRRSLRDCSMPRSIGCERTAWKSLRGPMNPSFNYEMGMLVDGFDQSPTFMMTYNPPCYPRLVEGYGGFEKPKTCMPIGVIWRC